MPEFVFQFGYEAPWEKESNERYGTDFESSQWTIIDAPDEAAALSWGCEIAEQFVQQTCGGSWREGDFSHDVEHLTECPWAIGRPPVVVGQFPDFTDWEKVG
jgi:hypothetical protein